MNSADLVNYVAELELPDCSMSFDGVVLEEEVPGYRTNSVTGRDSLSASLTEYDNGYVDGSTLLYRKFPSRDITVNFSIIASGADALRKSYDRLRSILYARGSEEVEIIFKDENDRFYLGTVSNVSGDDYSTLDSASNGSITIHCSSPFKWSVEEFEAHADGDGTIIVDYDGTYKTYPVLHATVNNRSLGYIGFVNDRKNIIQLGNPDELDYDLKSPSTTLINDNFVTSPESFSENWPTALKNSIVHENRELINRDEQIGELQALVAEDWDYKNIGNGVTRKFYLTSRTPSTNNGILSTNTNAHWAGGSRLHSFGLDGSTPITAGNFTCTMEYVLDDLKANVTNGRYHGEIRLQLAGTIAGTKRNVANVRIYISPTTDNLVHIAYTVLNRQYGVLDYKPPLQTDSNVSARNSDEYTPAERRAIYKKLAKSVSITKRGSTFEFNTPAGKKTVKVEGTDNVAVSEVGIWMLGIAKVNSISTTVKSAPTQFIDGKVTEGLTTISSFQLPSTVRNPSADTPIRVEVYGEKKKLNRVGGQTYTTTTTAKEAIAIRKKDTNYETGLLDTVITYDSANRRIKLLNRTYTYKTVTLKHAFVLRENTDSTSKAVKTLSKGAELTLLETVTTTGKVKAIDSRAIRNNPSETATMISTLEPNEVADIQSYTGSGEAAWLYTKKSNNVSGYMHYFAPGMILIDTPSYTSVGKWLRVQDKAGSKGYIYVSGHNDWYELVTNEKIRSDGYKWYIRGTYYYTGPDPDRKMVETMGVRSIKFVKKEYNTTVDIPNPFSKNDVVDVDCNTGEILLNGLSDYSLGALGNDWEEFCLYPGPNAVNCSFSDWATTQENYEPPEFSLTYRKAYI